MKYIDSEKLIAEIERLKERAQAERVLHPHTILAARNYLLIQDYDALFNIITSLQQEQPEVDLEEEIERFIEQHRSEFHGYFDLRRVARHFYELGLNSKKEEGK